MGLFHFITDTAYHADSRIAKFRASSGGEFSVDVAGNMSATGFLELPEVTAPAAPAANKGRLYFEDSGGKTRLMARFPSGAAQQIAIEP